MLQCRGRGFDLIRELDFYLPRSSAKDKKKKKNNNREREKERPTLKNLKSRADKIHRGKSLDFESHKFDGIGKHLDISTVYHN